MRLRDRLHSAMQAFREAPGRRTQLTTSAHQRGLAEQMLELWERESTELHRKLGEQEGRQ